MDATAFYAGIPFSSQTTHYVTSLVYDEIKHIKKNHDAVDILIETGRLTISNPESEFIEIVRNTANESGDLHELSVEDISIIALSLKLGAELITDDFAVSNVAKNLNIQVFPVMTDGIKNIVSWTYYCPGCNNNFSESVKCPKCGNTLKRKNLKK